MSCFKKSNLCKIKPISLPDPCVICLENTSKYTGCNRCKGCNICKKCYNSLKENNISRCPICNLECEKCKKGVEHKVCTWSTKKEPIRQTIIDIMPPIQITSETINEKKQCCTKCVKISYLEVRNALKIIPICCTFLLLCFFIGLIVVSSFNSGMKHDFSLSFGFTCIGVGFVICVLIIGVCNCPCCCNFNILKCIKELYCNNDH